MTFKIGDKVRFLNDVGGGIITAFIDEKMVEVQTEDGFEIPVRATDLLLDAGSGYGNEGNQPVQRSQAKKEAEPQKKVVVKAEDYRFAQFKGNAFLAIVPENETLLHVSDLKLYLVNDSNYSINYVISQNEGNVDELIKAGSLQPKSKLSVKKYVQSNLSKVRSIRMQGFFYKDGLMEHPALVDKTANIDGISFYKAGSFEKSKYFKSKAVVFTDREEEFDLREAVEKLSESDVIKVVSSKEQEEKKEAAKKSTSPNIEEVDLHIEHILESYSEMSNGEIVDAQLARFETALETALRAGTPKIVFIHGVGNGKLKHELRKKLDRKYSNLKYQDASFKEYGYGATMVYLK